MASRVWDRLALTGTAMVVVVIAGASFLLGEIYRVNPAWLFVAWNSILMVPLFIRQFREHLSKAPFASFLVAWALLHRAIVVCLMLWVRIFYWVPLIGIELLLGYSISSWCFGIEPRLSRRTGHT